MNLNESHAFVAVVRAGSFTAASRQLGVPKSTLSRQVSRLEERLGVSLLRRTTRRLDLTDVGDAYYTIGLRAIEGLEEAERVASEIAGKPQGLLRVSCSIDIGTTILPQHLHRFREAYPDVNVHKPREYWDYENLTVHWGCGPPEPARAHLFCNEGSQTARAALAHPLQRSRQL